MKLLRLSGVAFRALITRPGLWPTAFRQVRRFAPAGWWRRPPFLPVPDSDLIAFRSTTQYGEPDRIPDADDLVTWLTWCRSEARRRRG